MFSLDKTDTGGSRRRLEFGFGAIGLTNRLTHFERTSAVCTSLVRAHVSAHPQLLGDAGGQRSHHGYFYHPRPTDRLSFCTRILSRCVPLEHVRGATAHRRRRSAAAQPPGRCLRVSVELPHLRASPKLISGQACLGNHGLSQADRRCVGLCDRPAGHPQERRGGHFAASEPGEVPHHRPFEATARTSANCERTSATISTPSRSVHAGLA